MWARKRAWLASEVCRTTSSAQPAHATAIACVSPAIAAGGTNLFLIGDVLDQLEQLQRKVSDLVRRLLRDSRHEGHNG
jgi:hypothetical protein